jgi:uncharacterized membrane protein
MDDQGVITIELIFVTMMMLIVVASIITAISERMDAAAETRELGTARMIAESVSEAINKVYSCGNGHMLKVTLPPHIEDKSYKITVNSGGVFIELDGMIGKAYIIPRKISDRVPPTDSEVVMQGNMNYTISNVKDSEGYDWVIITSVH